MPHNGGNMPNQRSHLLTLADAFSAHRGISLWRLGVLAAGHSRFFFRLKRGGDCRTETYNRALQWFSDHWPDPPAWPEDIDRPEPDRDQRKAA